MKANVDYNDFIGTVAADISDSVSNLSDGSDRDKLNGFANYFKLNKDRFKIVGLSLLGTRGFNISLICVDKEKSTEEKEHIVTMSYNIENQKDILNTLFKRLHIVLYDRFDRKYVNMKCDEEVRYSELHDSDGEY